MGGSLNGIHLHNKVSHCCVCMYVKRRVIIAPPAFQSLLCYWLHVCICLFFTSCIVKQIDSCKSSDLPRILTNLHSAQTCERLPDFIGELLLVASSVAQFPVKESDEDQQDEDEEQGTHGCADYHRCSVRSCNISVNTTKIFLSEALLNENM